MKTHIVRREIQNCESLDEFLQYMENENIEQDNTWQDAIKTLCRNQGITLTTLSCLTQIPYQTMKKLAKKIPSTNRTAVIRIIAVLASELDQARQMLNRYAHIPDFYPKNTDDAIWLYLIQYYIDNNIAAENREVAKDFEELKAYIYENNLEETRRDESSLNVKTAFLNQKLANINNKEMLIEFLNRFSLDSCIRNAQLLADIEKIIKNNPIPEKRSVAALFHMQAAPLPQSDEYKYFSRCKRKISRNHIPDREFLIILALKLNLDTDSANQLLAKAGLYPLNVKNRLESMIFFFLEELNALYPAVLYNTTEREDAYQCPDVSIDLNNGKSISLQTYFLKHDCYDYIKLRIQTHDLMPENFTDIFMF